MTIESLIDEVLAAACDRNLQIAVAESCTGGLLASLLTDVPGRSHAFERGFVTYSDEAKAELLGVPANLIIRHGAVSEPVARAMAEGALRKSRAQVSAAITGYADDAGRESCPGRVFIAAAREGRATVVRHCEFGNLGRDPVRTAAARAALELFRLQIV